MAFHSPETGWYEFRPMDTTAVRQKLRELVGDWDKAGRNLTTLYQRKPGLSELCRDGTTLLLPTREGKVQMAWFPRPQGHKNSSQEDFALTQFISLLVNPFAEYLGGPCPRCDNYYIKKSKRQTIYCSSTCGARVTAISATVRSRKRDYERKIALAKKLIEKWSMKRRSEDWKTWVARGALGVRQDRMTVKWLTHAVNMGTLRDPSIL